MHSLLKHFEFTHCFPAKVSNVLNLKLATWLLFLPCSVCWLPSKGTMQNQPLSPFDISWRTFLGFYCGTEQLLKGIIMKRDFPSVDPCSTSQVFPQARPVITRSFSHQLLVKDTCMNLPLWHPAMHYNCIIKLDNVNKSGCSVSLLVLRSRETSWRERRGGWGGSL